MTMEQRALLESKMPDASYLYLSASEANEEQIAAADIILGNLPPERVALARNLKWIQLNSSGADAYVKPGVLAEGARLTNSTGAYGLAISEHLLAQTFFLKKKLAENISRREDCPEIAVNASDFRYFRRRLALSTNEIEALYSLMVLAELEAANLFRIIEGIRYGLSSEEIEKFIV